VRSPPSPAHFVFCRNTIAAINVRWKNDSLGALVIKELTIDSAQEILEKVKQEMAVHALDGQPTLLAPH
jgi:hypothetical protein